METGKDSEAQIEEVFSRGVEQVIDPNGAFKEKLLKKARGEYAGDIIVKFGVDPNRPDIHLGHAVVLRKLRALQNLGCKVVFLVGDFTARIGDPSGKSKVRPEVEQEEIERNLKTYVDQVGSILRTDKEVFSWIRNSDWFYAVSDIEGVRGKKLTLSGALTGVVDMNSYMGKGLVYENTRMQKTHLQKDEITSITLRGFLWTLRRVTHGRLVKRDMFQERIKDGKELYMHEMMYPVLQGVDSFVLARVYGSCDLEIGGTDQTFNMGMGRDVMEMNSQIPQAVMSMKILEGLDGKEKMSKSLDNYIAITDPAPDMYGKVMSIPDHLITRYYELSTFTPKRDIAEMETAMEKGEMNPKDAKGALARQIVAMYHGERAAAAAEEGFQAVFASGGIPEHIIELAAPAGALVRDVLVEHGVVSSKKEWERLVKSGAVTNMDTKEKITTIHHPLTEPLTIKIGKHTFVRLVHDRA